MDLRYEPCFDMEIPASEFFLMRNSRYSQTLMCRNVFFKAISHNSAQPGNSDTADAKRPLESFKIQRMLCSHCQGCRRNRFTNQECVLNYSVHKHI